MVWQSGHSLMAWQSTLKTCGPRPFARGPAQVPGAGKATEVVTLTVLENRLMTRPPDVCRGPRGLHSHRAPVVWRGSTSRRCCVHCDGPDSTVGLLL